MPLLNPVRFRHFALFAFAGLLAVSLTVFEENWAHAEKYQSRLNSLLLRKNDLYLPNRLIIGQEARFVVKAPAGSVVKVFVSTQGQGKVLGDLALRVGTDAQELSGTVPDTGVLELKMEVPKDPELDGHLVYVDAVIANSEQDVKPIDLVDSTGRRTEENSLPIKKFIAENGPSIMPSMPGMSPQMMNQLNTMSNIYGQGDTERKKLLDNGSINRDRALDRNPFLNRGMQQGIGGTSGY
jgi:hypothetical protein